MLYLFAVASLSNNGIARPCCTVLPFRVKAMAILRNSMSHEDREVLSDCIDTEESCSLFFISLIFHVIDRLQQAEYSVTWKRLEVESENMSNASPPNWLAVFRRTATWDIFAVLHRWSMAKSPKTRHPRTTAVSEEMTCPQSRFEPTANRSTPVFCALPLGPTVSQEDTMLRNEIRKEHHRQKSIMNTQRPSEHCAGPVDNKCEISVSVFHPESLLSFWALVDAAKSFLTANCIMCYVKGDIGGRGY